MILKNTVIMTFKSDIILIYISYIVGQLCHNNILLVLCLCLL